MRWPFTFYTDKGLLEGAAGTARGPLIFIRPNKKDDEGLYQHELTHVKQWFALLGFGFGIGYRFFPLFRLWAEVQAYKKQAEYYEDDRLHRFAILLATKYNLNITVGEALYLLRKN